MPVEEREKTKPPKKRCARIVKQLVKTLDFCRSAPYCSFSQHERPTKDFAWPPSPFALQVRVSFGRMPMIEEPYKPHGRVCSVPPSRAREPRPQTAKCEPAERAFLVLFCLPALMLFCSNAVQLTCRSVLQGEPAERGILVLLCLPALM